MKIVNWITFGLLVFCLNYNAQTQDSIPIIEGTFENSPIQKVYLMAADDYGIYIADSAIIGPDNKKIRFKGVKPFKNDFTTYYFSFEKRGTNNYLFFLNNENLLFHIDINQSIFEAMCIDTLFKGVPRVSEVFKFRCEMQFFFKRIRDLRENFTYIDEKDTITQKSKEIEIKNVNIEACNFLINKLLTFKYSSSVWYAIRSLRLNFWGFVEMSPILDSLEKKFPNSHHVKIKIEEFRNLLIEEKKSKENDRIINNTAISLINLPNINEKNISLVNYLNEPVLLLFWASWCAPCKSEMPEIIKIYKKYKEKGFKVFAVSLDNDKEKWKKAIKEWNMEEFINVIDINKEAAKQYHVNAIPSSFLINKNKKIVAINPDLFELVKTMQKLYKDLF